MKKREFIYRCEEEEEKEDTIGGGGGLPKPKPPVNDED